MTSLNKAAAASIWTLITSFAVLGTSAFIYVIDGISAQTLTSCMLGGLGGFGVGMIGTAGCIIYEECHPKSSQIKNERMLLISPPKIVIATELATLPSLAALPSTPPSFASSPSHALPKKKI